MHPSIAQFSAEHFYHGRLQSGVEESVRVPPEGFAWPQDAHGVAFINCDGSEEREGDSRSNADEVALVAEVVSRILMAKELSVLDVGIVSPYSAQVRQLRHAVQGQLNTRLWEAGVDVTGGLKGRRAAKALEIASVDAFQGREKELIVFSAVRSNAHGNVGFLADWRRLNVMITRARRGLVVIGNAATLRVDPTWASWLDWAERRGFIVDAGAYTASAIETDDSCPAMVPRGSVLTATTCSARAQGRKLRQFSQENEPHQWYDEKHDNWRESPEWASSLQTTSRWCSY